MIIILSLLACLLMFGICYLGTGTDEKNLNALRSYPKEVQDIIMNSDKYKGKIKEKNNIKIFISNIFMFSIILFVFGIFIKEKNFINNFFNILIIGESINLFDLLIIDLLWFRNSKRVRFSNITDSNLYSDAKNHIKSFIKAIFMLFIVALIDGIILTII